MEEVQEARTITIDNKVYDLDKLPERIKSLIGVHQEWVAELRTQRLAFAKTEAAIRDLVREIVGAVADDKVEPIATTETAA